VTGDEQLRLALTHAEAWWVSRTLAHERIAELLARHGDSLDAGLRGQAAAVLERLIPEGDDRRGSAVVAVSHGDDVARSMGEHGPVSGPALAGTVDARLAMLAGDGRWECDAVGTLILVDGAAPFEIGDDLLAAGDGETLWSAFIRRTAFADVPVGTGDARWRLNGVPFFEAATGRFAGYRGVALRAGRTEAAMPGDTLAKVAHEVRSPLNAIMGFAQMIEGETLGPVADRHRRLAAVILDNATRLLGALDDLIDAARLDQGQWWMEHVSVEAGPLVRRMAARHRPAAAARGAALAETLPDGLPLLAGDPRSLERALDRLLAALVAASVPGEALLVGGQAAPDGVRLFVTRPGALEDLSADRLMTATPAEERGLSGAPLLGLGFGLRLVRRLVEAMGGRFDIEPHRFAIVVPAAGEQGVAKDAESS